MCDVLSALERAKAAFLSQFDAPPRALRVWARGKEVRSNAALQMAAQSGKAVEECEAFLIKNTPKDAAFCKWDVSCDGMLRADFTAQYLTRAAFSLAGSYETIKVTDSRMPYFFESCALLRAESLLTPLASDASLDEIFLDDVSDASRKLSRAANVDISWLYQKLEARLDALMMCDTRGDLYAWALSGALSLALKKIRIQEERI